MNISQYLLALSFLKFIPTPILARQDFPGRVAGWVGGWVGGWEKLRIRLKLSRAGAWAFAELGKIRRQVFELHIDWAKSVFYVIFVLCNFGSDCRSCTIYVWYMLGRFLTIVRFQFSVHSSSFAVHCSLISCFTILCSLLTLHSYHVSLFTVHYIICLLPMIISGLFVCMYTDAELIVVG